MKTPEDPTTINTWVEMMAQPETEAFIPKTTLIKIIRETWERYSTNEETATKAIETIAYRICGEHREAMERIKRKLEEKTEQRKEEKRQKHIRELSQIIRELQE